jgi:ribosome-associated translation inhibitor RaiA
VTITSSGLLCAYPTSTARAADKRCHLQVVLAGLPDVVVEDTEADLYVAIDRATDRAGRTLVRKIDRRQTAPAGMHER